jgi:hypothetical protein
MVFSGKWARGKPPKLLFKGSQKQLALADANAKNLVENLLSERDLCNED